MSVQMFSKAILSIIFILNISITYSQKSFEDKIFSEVCNALILHNENILIKEKLSSFKIQYTIPDLEIIIDTIKDISIQEEEIIKDFTEEKLIEILSANDYSIFPLTNKITIIDSLIFFDKKTSYKMNSYFIKTTTKNKVNEQQFKLARYEALENKFFLSLSLNDVYLTIALNGETFKLEEYKVFQLR
ncbi:MAG: hypothetical protein ACPG4Y_07210 [Chitinophagales bacterium]